MELGFIRWIADMLMKAIDPAPADRQLLVAMSLILWVSAMVSAFLVNIP